MKVNYDALNEYEKKFKDKIDLFQEHDKYKWLRQYSDEAISFHTGFGFYAIKAKDFIDRIIAAPENYISDWLSGKNELEWTGIKQ